MISRLVILFSCLVSVAFAQNVRTPTTSPCTAFGTTSGTCAQGNDSRFYAAGQIPGTATNDGASAGNVGEYVVSGASAANNIGFGATTVTITIASPAVVSWTSNPYYNSTATGNGCASLVVFGTSGSLPTGLTAGTNYYVTCDATFTASAFHVSSSVANAIAGTAINTSGSQSGTQTASNIYSATSGTAADFGGMSLSAGDWDVTGIVRFGVAATTSITALKSEISTGSAISGTGYAVYQWETAAEVPGAPIQAPMSTERVSLSATTTVFCGETATFTVSTFTYSGLCRARRVR
jgi:hypothetical protein